MIKGMATEGQPLIHNMMTARPKQNQRKTNTERQEFLPDTLCAATQVPCENEDKKHNKGKTTASPKQNSSRTKVTYARQKQNKSNTKAEPHQDKSKTP